MRRILFLGLALFLAAAPAQADDYEKPSLKSLMKTLVRFSAIDLRRDDLIDVYGKITECDLYIEYYKDDFKWQRIRSALRKSVKQDVATFPVAYYFDAILQLERYDFKEKLFRFTPRTAQASSNVFSVQVQPEEFCTRESVDFPPTFYKFVLDKPLKMMGIPMNAQAGEKLLVRMDAANNKERLVYTRFKFRIGYIAPLKLKMPETPEARNKRQLKSFGPMVVQEMKDAEVIMDSRVDSIEYYEDPERTRLIYSFSP